MFQICVEKWKKKICERGYTLSTFAKSCGIPLICLKYYLKHPEKTPFCLIKRAAKILCDSRLEAEQIFFAPKLTFCESKLKDQTKEAVKHG